MGIAKILVVMPDGKQLHAHYPVEPEAWNFEDGRDFFKGLMQKAFPAPRGVHHKYLISIERAEGGLMIALSVEHRTMQIGPFNPSAKGLDGIWGCPEFTTIERKDITSH